MTVLKALVPCGTGIRLVDVIKHDGHFWLVPHWWHFTEKGYARPARIVRITEVQHQRVFGQGHQFLLNYPIPEGVLDGSLPAHECAGLVVVDNPNVNVPMGHG